MSVLSLKIPRLVKEFLSGFFCPAVAGRADHDGMIAAVRTPLQTVSPARQTVKA
jgi:hypothetical protein